MAISEKELRWTHERYVANKGSLHSLSRETGMARSTLRERLKKAKGLLGLEWETPITGGRVNATKAIKRPLPKGKKVKRYICTGVQNNTDAFTEWFTNLSAFAEYMDAEIMCAQFTYNKGSYGGKSVKPGKGPTAADTAELWYDPMFDPYIVDGPIELAPTLIFSANMNILPTTSRPLSSYQTHTGLKSTIIPHAKLAMQSVAGTKSDGAKFLYTTGASTMRNYIQKNAGIKAEHHHAYAALMVEVLSDGTWFVRQLNGGDDGSFYDLDVHVENGEMTTDHRAEAVTWGDIHTEVADPEIIKLAFDGPESILDTLHPREQFIHDVVDFRARNHHEIKNPHAMFKRYSEQSDTVQEEMERVVEMFGRMHRDWCMTIAVDSNHDRALERWLQETDFKKDPANALFYLRCQLAVYEAIDNNDPDFHLVRDTLQKLGLGPEVLFLGLDDSYVICTDDDGMGGIECGMHGHIGPNGSRGSPIGLSKMGRKANTAHTHSATIMDGLYVAGTFTRLSLDYNKGPSSWSHSFIVTYPNGKRTVVTIQNGQWRAER